MGTTTARTMATILGTTSTTALARKWVRGHTANVKASQSRAADVLAWFSTEVGFRCAIAKMESLIRLFVVLLYHFGYSSVNIICS